LFGQLPAFHSETKPRRLHDAGACSVAGARKSPKDSRNPWEPAIEQKHRLRGVLKKGLPAKGIGGGFAHRATLTTGAGLSRAGRGIMRVGPGVAAWPARL